MRDMSKPGSLQHVGFSALTLTLMLMLMLMLTVFQNSAMTVQAFTQHHVAARTTVTASPLALAATGNHESIADAPARSWKELEAELNAQPKQWFSQTGPSSIDSALNPSKPSFSTEHPTLFRERHGWCPYSERVWLTLELIGQEYDTIRIDNTGGPRPSYFGGQTPQMKWPDGRTQGESMDLVAELDRRYNDGALRCDDANVKQCINQFRNVFPRARPSSRAAFLFQYNGEPLWKSTFEETLQGTDDLLATGCDGKGNEGPFFCGAQLTAADIAWVPFLERYRYQLPCLHAGLDPACSTTYPHLSRWYAAMDAVPEYACHVKGNASSWRKVLSMAGFANAGFPPQIQSNADACEAAEATKLLTDANLDVWRQYASSRDHVPEDGPHVDAASTIVRNREALVKDTAKRMEFEERHVDEALRKLTATLLTGATTTHDDDVRQLAEFLDDRMCVPRDMGAMSAARIKILGQ